MSDTITYKSSKPVIRINPKRSTEDIVIFINGLWDEIIRQTNDMDLLKREIES
jgi:hypothetical protein